MRSDAELVLAVDGGGTSVRVAIADLSGTVLVEARGGGINPNSGGNPNEVLLDTIGRAIEQLPTQSRGAIVGGVAGLAGVLTATESLRTALDRALQAHRVHVKVHLVSDVVAAFWSGFPLSSTGAEEVHGGHVLVAGTGAVGGAVHGAELLAMADGYGYLLGDRGGGAWLGIEAVRAALDGATGRGPDTALTDLILQGRGHQEVIADVYRRPPREVGQFAPLVGQAAASGDAVALMIVERAIAELVTTLDSLPGRPAAPVVLVGSVAAGEHLVARGLHSALRESGRAVVVGGDGIAGAITLATRLSRQD